MKKLFLFAATLLGLVACNKNEADINVPARQITIHATADMNNGSAASGPHRIAPNDITASSVSFHWQEGDKVWVLSGDFSEKQIFTIDNSSINGNQANFTGTALSDMSLYYVAYDDNNANEEMLMALVSGAPATLNYRPDDKNWVFSGYGMADNFSITSYPTVRMQLKGSCKLGKVTYLCMSENPGEYLPTAMSINFVHGSYDGLQLTSTPVEVVMPITRTLPHGFTLRFYDTDGNLIMEKSKAGASLYDDLYDYGLVNLGVLEVADPYNGHAYVDLGLPSGLKWATMNVGATKPEEYGDYFAWGETAPYYNTPITDPLTWKTGKENGYAWQSYCGMSSFMEWSPVPYDADKNLLLTKDAASVNWGGAWRMPTAAQFEELLANCTSVWTDNYNSTGVTGRIFTSNKEGYTDKSIFLPAAGFFNGTSNNTAGSNGYYWSSSRDTGYSRNGRDLYFISGDVRMGYVTRYYGMPVRPVCQ